MAMKYSPTASVTALARLSVGIAAGIGIATLGFSATAFAQVGAAQPLQDPNQEQANPFSDRGSSQVKGVMDMIHNAVLGPSMSDSEFRESQQENFNSAIDEFRAKQQQELMLRNPGSSAATSAPATTAPAPATNPTK